MRPPASARTPDLEVSPRAPLSKVERRTRVRLGRRARMSGIAFAVAAALLSAVPAGAKSVRDDVTFSTTGRALFGANQGQGDATKTLPILTAPLFHFGVEPETFGQIYRLPQDLPVETTQAIWQQAIDTCRTKLTATRSISIEIPVIGTVTRSCRGSVTPTESQCINGGTIRPTISATCCVFGGTYPSCTSGQTITVSTNKISFDVGPAVGPKPTTGTTRPYDVGVIATMHAEVGIGIEGGLVLDGGSVDVRYPTSFRLETSADAVRPGDLFQLTARHSPGAVSLTSEYPNISFFLQRYSKLDVGAQVEYAGIDYDTGAQIHSSRTVQAFSTTGNAQADNQGRIVTEIFDVKAGLGAGLQVRVNTDIALGGEIGRKLDPNPPFVLPIEFPFDVTFPPKPAPFCEVLPRPDCNLNPIVSTDIVEMLFRTPLLDTPAFPGFYGGNDFTGVAGQDVPIAQARNQLLADGTVRNTTITGKRDALQSSLEAVGGDLSKLGITDGVVDTDLLRFGLDIDGSLIAFGLPPGGGQVELPPQLPAGFPIKKLAGKRLLEIEANLVDLDALDYLYFDQEIVFHPNLAVELVFDKPVRVRLPGSSELVTVTPNAEGELAVRLSVQPDRDTSLEIEQPAGGVTVTPRYSIEDNLFENNLDWLINTGVQGTVGQIIIGGYITAIVAPLITGLTDVETLNFALGQFQPTFDEPLRFPAHDHFPLGGFGDPLSGTSFAVAVATGPPLSPTPIVSATMVSGTPAPTPTSAGPTPGGATATPVASSTATPTATSSATPTRVVTDEEADLNCDGHASAGDVVGFLRLVAEAEEAACVEAQLDLDHDGAADETDLARVIEQLFVARR